MVRRVQGQEDFVKFFTYATAGGPVPGIMPTTPSRPPYILENTHTVWHLARRKLYLKLPSAQTYGCFEAGVCGLDNSCFEGATDSARERSSRKGKWGSDQAKRRKRAAHVKS